MQERREGEATLQSRTTAEAKAWGKRRNDMRRHCFKNTTDTLVDRYATNCLLKLAHCWLGAWNRQLPTGPFTVATTIQSPNLSAPLRYVGWERAILDSPNLSALLRYVGWGPTSPPLCWLGAYVLHSHCKNGIKKAVLAAEAAARGVEQPCPIVQLLVQALRICDAA